MLPEHMTGWTSEGRGKKKGLTPLADKAQSSEELTLKGGGTARAGTLVVCRNGRVKEASLQRCGHQLHVAVAVLRTSRRHKGWYGTAILFLLISYLTIFFYFLCS